MTALAMLISAPRLSSNPGQSQKMRPSASDPSRGSTTLGKNVCDVLLCPIFTISSPFTTTTFPIPDNPGMSFFLRSCEHHGVTKHSVKLFNGPGYLHLTSSKPVAQSAFTSTSIPNDKNQIPIFQSLTELVTFSRD